MTATAEAVTLPFEDVNPYNNQGVYYCPNEDFLLWRSFLRDLHIQRAAGICSAGEIGFFSLLTHARKELLLIDHSYASLAVAMCKYLALQEHGWKVVRERLSTHSGCKDLFREYREKLPEKVKEPFSLAFLDSWYTEGIIDEWKAVPPAVLRKACNKLDRVQFLHGDLSDLKDRGEFDLLYLSNALEHTGRNGSGYTICSQVEAAVKNGGHVLVSGHIHRKPANWVQVKRQNGVYEPGRRSLITWVYNLYRIEK